MKININKVNVTPKNMGFNFCVFGLMSEDVKAWCEYHGFQIETSEKYSNIILPDMVDFNSIFETPKHFKYFDGFSPNLNKHLHLGHLSNLIIAKAIQKLNISDETIAILGDTLDGAVEKEDALSKYKNYLHKFDYNLNELFYASGQKLSFNFLIEGTDEYVGTKIFDLKDEKIVGVKSNGNTTYFYQDVALAQKLNAPTLYLTGFEQNNHFNSLKKIFPSIEHKGLGLVLIKGKKMSSSEGNVYFAEDVLNHFKEVFPGNDKLVYNVLAGQILKYSLATVKNIQINEINSVKTSLGLYLSYTMARMFSAGIKQEKIKEFSTNELNYFEFKSKYLIEPNFLFNALVDLCKHINTLYATHHIKDNPINQDIFQKLTNDLILGCEKLGLFIVDKV